MAPPVTRKASWIPDSANSKANSSEKLPNAKFSVILQVYFKATRKIILSAIIINTSPLENDCGLN
jgi:hypothetical protein